MIELLLIGIGSGNPDHLTLEAVKALKSSDLILLPLKGEAQAELVYVRRAILAEHLAGASAIVVEFEMPERDRGAADYVGSVERWHDAIAAVWQREIKRALPGSAGRVALLVWGDPSLYDSTLRIAGRLKAASLIGPVRIIPGLTSIQLLTSAHGIPLNEIGGSILVTTGRQLAERSWPADIDTLVVMLDRVCAFESLLSQPGASAGITIWWGAYLGLPQQIIIQGPLATVASHIVETRGRARGRYGWIMDTYLLRRHAHATTTCSTQERKAGQQDGE